MTGKMPIPQERIICRWGVLLRSATHPTINNLTLSRRSDGRFFHLSNFYFVTNGWRETGYFIYDILPVEKVDCLRIRDSHLYDIACRAEKRQDIPDNYYYEQGTQVKRSLAISSEGDAAIWLLDPGEQDAQGEWAGGCWASWIPGMEWRATSFRQLIELELEDFISFHDGEE